MIVAMPNIDAVNSWQPPATGVIKDGFMRADGTIINAGHVSQGCLPHTLSGVIGSGSVDPVTGTIENRPNYMNCFMIIRVK